MSVIDIDFDKGPHVSAKEVAAATWRMQVIAPALDYRKRSPSRRKVVEDLAAQERMLPSGRIATVTTATIYNWINAYEAHGLQGLIRKRRCDAGKSQVAVTHVWDGFFLPRITPALAQRIQGELDEAIHDFWEAIDATRAIVCMNATEWLLHRSASLGVKEFESLPLGSLESGAGGECRYGICWINGRRIMRHR